MSGRTKVLFIVFLVVILAIGSFLIFRHKDSSGASSQSEASSSGQTVTSGGQLEGGQYIIKSLGIKFPLPDELKGLSATTEKSPANVNPPVSVVELHLQSYTDLANKCLGTPTNTPQSFANISSAQTLNGNLPPGVSKPLKKFQNFYITSLGSSVPANIKCQDKLTQQKLNDLSGQLNKALAQAFASAQTL